MSKRSVVAAIDFGTAYSGFAYCKRSAYESNQTTPQIIVHKWLGDTHITEKAPTCVLFRPDKSFHSFGYDAIHYFQENPDKNDFKDWFYFEHFKMILYNADELTAETNLVASNDTRDSRKTPMKTVDVFAAVIKFMKDQLFEDIKMTEAKLFTDGDIQWVITVPAIWDLRARQFMIEAAKKAGIPHDQIISALEPEAASLFCRKVPISVETWSGRMSIATLAIGSKYIVLDQGGGTTDIAIHEITSLCSLKEIHHACGGHWGGDTVNRQFQRFLEELLRDDFLNHMKKADPSAYFLLFHKFEQAKIAFTSEDLEQLIYSYVTIRLPNSWLTQHKHRYGMELKDKVANSIYSEYARIDKDRFRLKKSYFRNFYNYSINCVEREIKKLTEDFKAHGIKKLLVVGGHSSSTVVTDALKNAFKDLDIVVAKDPFTTVMKGAVLYGFEPQTITRISNKPLDPDNEASLNLVQVAVSKCAFCSKIGIFYCHECELTFCKECREKWHDKLPSAKKHFVENKRNFDPTMKRPKIECIDHKEEYVFSCMCCNSLICSTCVTTTHCGHRIAKVSAIVSKCRKIAGNQVSKLKSQLQEINSQISSLSKAVLSEAKDDASNATKHMETAVKRITKVLHHKERIRMNYIEDANKLQLEEINYSLNEMKKTYKQQESVCQSIERLLGEKHDVTFYTTYNVLKREIADLSVIANYQRTTKVEPFDTERFVGDFVDSLLAEFNMRIHSSEDGKIVFKAK